MTEITELREKLEPCPFCGGGRIALEKWADGFDPPHVTWIARCSDCRASTGSREEEQKDTVTSWNRRSLSTRPEALVKALEWFVARAGDFDGIPPSKYHGDIDCELRYPDKTEITVTLGQLRAVRSAQSTLPVIEGDGPTHRHKKRGSEYTLIGVGKMQAERWLEPIDGDTDLSVDMREVAIYRSVDDGSLWVRPVEEFQDGRFEPLPSPPTPTEGRPIAALQPNQDEGEK